MDARQRCPNCGSNVEALAFCGVCGRPLPDGRSERDDSPRGRLTFALKQIRARPQLSMLIIASVVIFLLLLGGQAGVATLVALLVAPYLLLSWLTRLDLYEREPWALLGSVVGAGAVLGLLGGWLSSLIFERFWFNDTRLNLGAVGFSGVSANGEGGVPFGVLLLNGIVLPVLIGAAVMAGPIVLRRWPVFRNEILDGMTLGGLAAAGFATFSGIVYFWPGVFDHLPDRPVGEWTAILSGILVLRPAVLILAGSLLGIAAWQYASSRDMRTIIVAGVAGAFGWLALPLGSLILAQSGAVTEFVWYLIALVVVGVLFREALRRGLAQDQAVLSPVGDERRVVCPNCHRVTPDGTFCSFCRAPLHEPQPAVLAATQGRRTDAADEMPPVAHPVMSRGARQPPDHEQDDAAETTPIAQPPPATLRTSADLAEEPEADPLDYLVDGNEYPSEEPTLQRAESLATTAPVPGSRLEPIERDQPKVPVHDDGSADRTDVATGTQERDDEDAGIFPTEGTSEPEVPVPTERPESSHPTPSQPAPVSIGEPGSEPAVPVPSGSPWSNVRPFRSAAGSDQDKPAARPAWMPGAAPDLRSVPRNPAPNDTVSSRPFFVDPDRAHTDGEGDVASSEDVMESSAEEPHRPVSSSGRWFDASASRPDQLDEVNAPDSTMEGDQRSEPGDKNGSGLPESREAGNVDPVDGDPGSGVLAEADVAAVAPPVFRWRDAEPGVASDQGTDAESEENPDPPSASAQGSPDRPDSGSSENDSPVPTNGDSPVRRPGLWRQFTRQIRPAAAEPHRSDDAPLDRSPTDR